MDMRDLVNGGAACAIPGSSSSSSNPLGALTNALLGCSSKTQERLKEIPNATPSGPRPQFYSEYRSLPGSELDQNGLGAAWDEVQRDGPTMPPMGPMYEPTFEGPPQRVLSNFLHSFVVVAFPFVQHLSLCWDCHKVTNNAYFSVADSLSCMPSTWVVGGCRGQSQLMSNQMRSMDMQHLAAMEQTRKLAHTLSQDGNPIFQVGVTDELIIDENEMKPGPASGEWATEYEQQYLGPPSWANQFANEQLSHGPEQWAGEFASGKGQQESAEEKWVNEFSKLNVDDWVDEFAEGPVGGSSADAWGNAYDEFLTERNAEKHASGIYVFSDMNPYVGHPEPMKEGLELFRKGLHSEAALALEAEEADPSNLEVLLALGVSHTSELEQATALKYLYGWLRSHPKYGTIAPPELADSLYHADALDLKPNYVRALANMGISYANQGMYKESIPYYVRALAMNPKADNAWQYLRLSCASRQNLIQACEARNLDVLQKEFPL
ncbi:hypothetical protein Bca101_048099 [Brassica carinata]